MTITIDKQARESAYLQVYRQLREQIVAGLIPFGARLPSKRQLAAELDLSLITVEHALALLVDEGYAASRPRSGLYACFGGQPQALPPRAALADMSLPAELPEDFPFSVLARIMRRVLSEQGERILARSPGSGCPELRSEIAAYLARSRGLRVSPEQIVVGSGAEYLYGLVVQLLGRERLYAREEPCYERIRLVYEVNGAVCRGLPMGPEGVESAALAACEAGALHVTPYHSYPSGVTATAAKRHEYAAWARSRDAYLIEDDYDSELSVRSGQVDTICSLAPERVIYLNTFSKTVAPSVRIGYMVLPEPLLPLYERKLGFYSCTVPVYEQLVLAEYIRCGELERSISRRRRKLREAEKRGALQEQGKTAILKRNDL